jgi:hypothetical protein
MKKRILIGVLATTILVLGLVGAVVIYNFGFRQRFEVVSAAKITVFLDIEGTQELQQGQTLTWGQITTTDPQHQTLYIKNTGTVNVTLQFNYDTQQFPGDWSLSWDYDNIKVLTGENRTVIMTLTLPSNIGEGTQECNSWIAATPVP